MLYQGNVQLETANFTISADDVAVFPSGEIWAKGHVIIASEAK
jgi:hypothetical protein